MRKLMILAACASVLPLTAPAARAAAGKGPSGHPPGMHGYCACFGLDPATSNEPKPNATQGWTLRGSYAAIMIRSNAPGNVFHPGEQPELTFQLQNLTDQAITVRGKVESIRYSQSGRPGDQWYPELRRLELVGSAPIDVKLPPKGWQDLTVRPPMPETKGGYGFVVDLGDAGRQYLTSAVRTFKPALKRVQFPKQSLEHMPPAILERLGVQAVRYGISFIARDEGARYEQLMERVARDLREMHAHKVTCAAEIGAGTRHQPLGRGRPHLDDNAVMRQTKQDMAWLPSRDDEYQKLVYDLACTYGWPKGPITGFMLWNEPWEGLSISGWGADMIRYRTIYERIGRATERARKDAKVDVLVGGCDSSSNTWDKLLPDGSDKFMKYLDFCSIHYQGMSSPCLYRAWRERKHGNGRVLIWDTESWVANTDDRIAGVIATNRAAGYDRSLGVFYGYLTTAMSHDRKHWAKVHHTDGTVVPRFAQPEYSWPAAAAFLAAQKFIGEREFREILFKRGLPWVYVFDGLRGNPDDGTVVVVGDIGRLFQPERVLYRTVRSLAEITPEAVRQRQELERRIREETDRPVRRELETQLKGLNTRQDGRLTIDAKGAPFSLFDFYGNRIEAREGRTVVPLDTRGYFLRADPSRKGSFAQLIEAVRKAAITGLEPVELIPLDMLARIPDEPALRVNVANILNRPVKGKLSLQMEGVTLEYDADVALGAYESTQVVARITGGEERSDNGYPLKLAFDAGPDGFSVHEDTMRVNLIHRRTIAVDGKLDDWRGCLPQIIQTDEAARRTFTESAWLPFEELRAEEAGGFAAGFVAYDDQQFYFAAKIVDDTPHPGTLRYETRDDREFFYPPVAYHTKTDRYGMPIERIELKWPEGLRRFSYRRHPTLPSGGQGAPFDNALIAFNAIPFEQEQSWVTHLPGRMPKFVFYKCTDYEYAFNMVAPKYGGGFEVWRLDVPGMPRKHFYPRQPKHPLEGAVKTAKLVTAYRGGARYTEAAIPWGELPHVKKLLDAGQTVKFSYKVNHNTGGPCMELARQRSVSRVNPRAFHVDWREHWANELEFAFEK